MDWNISFIYVLCEFLTATFKQYLSGWTLCYWFKSCVFYPYLYAEYRRLVEEYLVIILGYFFPVLHKKHVLWVLIRSASVSHFSWTPKSCTFMEKYFNKKNYPRIITKHSSLTNPLRIHLHTDTTFWENWWHWIITNNCLPSCHSGTVHT